MAEDHFDQPHKLTLNERRQLSMTGATEVVRFDESAILIRTQLGALLIQGRDLQLKNLSLEGGRVDVEGTVSALSYEEPRQHTGWLRGLLG